MLWLILNIIHIQKMNSMKQFIILFLLIPSFFYAQNHEEKREKIKQLKIVFLTTELNLDSDEAAKFWPIYNNAENEIYEISKVRYQSFKKYIKDKKESEITESDAKKYVELVQDCDKKILAIKAKLNADLGANVSYKKIVFLKKAEENFKQKLLEQYRKK